MSNRYINVIVKMLCLINLLSAQQLGIDQIIFSGGQYFFPPYERNGKHLGSVTEIYKKDLNSGEVKVIHSGVGSQKFVSVSPNGQYIASIQYGIKEEFNPYRLINNLIIIDQNGNLIKEINADVRRYSWSPDGSKIAYITGEYREAKMYRVTGYWIYDFSSGENRSIDGVGYELHWANFDQNIYLKIYEQISRNNTQLIVYMYDPINGILKKTDYKGINFSPGGTYYYKKDIIGSGNRLFIRDGNIDITNSITNLPFDPSKIPWKWVSDEVLALYGINVKEDGSTRKTIIYDVSYKSILKETNGTPLVTSVHDSVGLIIMEKERYEITGRSVQVINHIWEIK